MINLNALEKQYLSTSGWLRSVVEARAVDATGAVPWFTYPAIRYLEKIVSPSYRVLEFGSGNSSRWWARHVKEVVSVEHDPLWAQALREDQLGNLTVMERTMDDIIQAEAQSIMLQKFFPLGRFGIESPDPTRNYRAGLLDAPFQAYAAVGLEYPAGYFDVIVVDGMARVLTAWVAVQQISKTGMVIFDNSDRDEYAEGYAFLSKAGFHRIDFWGLGPINPYEWCTSIFVRSLDVLEKKEK